jgi:MFS family permease
MSSRPTSYRQWLVSFQLSNLPQGMAPIALTLATMSMSTRGFNVGTALITAMSFSQVVFAVPLGRLGDRLGAFTFLRYALATRAALIVMLAVGIGAQLPAGVLIAVAAGAGATSGPIYGALRSLLSDIVPVERLPKALALAATVGEMVFVAGPVLAAALNVLWPLLPVGVMAAALAGSALTLPAVRVTRQTRSARGRVGSIPPAIFIWTAGGFANSAATALVEVGAVKIALDIGLPAGIAAVFAVALCVSSATGGALATWLGPPTARPKIIVLLSTTLAGGLCVYAAEHVVVAISGAILIGLCLAPLMTCYSLRVEALLPSSRRTEGFSWLRMSNALGVATTSLLLTVYSIEQVALVIVVALGIVITIVSLTRHGTTVTTSPAHSITG